MSLLTVSSVRIKSLIPIVCLALIPSLWVVKVIAERLSGKATNLRLISAGICTYVRYSLIENH